MLASHFSFWNHVSDVFVSPGAVEVQHPLCVRPFPPRLASASSWTTRTTSFLSHLPEYRTRHRGLHDTVFGEDDDLDVGDDTAGGDKTDAADGAAEAAIGAGGDPAPVGGDAAGDAAGGAGGGETGGDAGGGDGEEGAEPSLPQGDIANAGGKLEELFFRFKCTDAGRQFKMSGPFKKAGENTYESEHAKCEYRPYPKPRGRNSRTGWTSMSVFVGGSSHKEDRRGGPPAGTTSIVHD